MIKFPEQWCKVNSKLKYKKMIVCKANVILHIPLFLPVNYGKELNFEEKDWMYGSEILLEM